MQALRGPAQSHKLPRLKRIRIIPKMFHVKHFRPIGAQNLTSGMTAAFLGVVGSFVFLVQLESGG